MSQKFKKILIIKPSALGDVITALPALNALRKAFPAAHIAWLIRPEFAPLLEANKQIDELILFDRKTLGKAWKSTLAMRELWNLIKKLRSEEFDAVVDFQGLARTGILGWLSGAKKRFGMADAREFAPVFYNVKVPADADKPHVVDYYLKIVNRMGAEIDNPRFVFPENADANGALDELLGKSNIKKDKYAVLIPASAQVRKCWSGENFAILARKLMSEQGFSVLVTGTKSENDISQSICDKADGAVNIAGKTDLKTLVALLAKASLVVSNDTGPGHIAGALCTPLVMIFGPSNPRRIYPYQRPETLAAVEPFDRGKALFSPSPRHAIDAVTVDMVYDKACQQLKTHKPQHN